MIYRHVLNRGGRGVRSPFDLWSRDVWIQIRIRPGAPRALYWLSPFYFTSRTGMCDGPAASSLRGRFSIG